MIIKELKGGSFSKTLVIENDGMKIVRKFISRHVEREYGLVRWQSQIRKLQIMSQSIGVDYVPKVISLGYDEDSYYYDIEYFENSKTVLDFLLTPYENINIETVFDNLIKVIDNYKIINFGPVKGAFSLYIQEEIVNILSKILTYSNFDSLTNVELREIKDICSNVLDLIKRKSNYLAGIKLNETLTHGNLTLENVLIDSMGNIKLIDLYAETYCESWLGDISQIMQSCIGDYEQINDLNEDDFNSLFTKKTVPTSKFYEEFKGHLNRFALKLSHEDRFALEVFYASQFIRMFPFKIEKTPRKAFYFVVQGMKTLNKVLTKC
ncbi:hypothetical protein [Marinomonas sp.]|uniref:hypothetical protein n=1 Tax=Marinomonas sp. TaxID=1904862 RepID=UPI003BA9D144